MDYSIVIPVYKSKKSLQIIEKKVNELFLTVLVDKSYELIFVNDSPFDKETCAVLNTIYHHSEHVRLIEFTKNFGQQSAVLCGIENSTGKYVLTMDDDMQHDPFDIPKLIEKEKNDIVIATFKNKKHNLFKRVTSSIKGYFDYLILGKPKHIKLTSFRLFNRVVADNILKIGTSYPFIPALLFSVSDNIVNVEVAHYARVEGSSHYTLSKMIKLFSNLLISNSSLLLKFVGYIGLLSAVISFLYAITILYQKIVYDIALQGWSSIMIAILFFGGMSLFMLGVIGEYLIRIIHTSENRPHYFIRNIKAGKDV